MATISTGSIASPRACGNRRAAPVSTHDIARVDVIIDEEEVTCSTTAAEPAGSAGVWRQPVPRVDLERRLTAFLRGQTKRAPHRIRSCAGGDQARDSNRYRGRCMVSCHALVHACDPLDDYASCKPPANPACALLLAR